MLNYLIEPVFDYPSVTNRHSDLPIKHVIFPIASSWITRGHFPVKPLQVLVIHSQQHGFQGLVMSPTSSSVICLRRYGCVWKSGTHRNSWVGLIIFDVNKSRNDYWFMSFPPCFRSAPGALQRLWWAERGNVHCNGALICLTCLEPIRRCPKMWLCTPESSILLFFSTINHPAIGVHLWSYEDLRFSKKNMCKSSSVCVSNLGILVSIFLRFPEPVTPLENTPTVTNY